MNDAIEHTNPDPSLETNRRPTIQHDGYEKVFGIGLPKTATTSLEQAFVNLGFRKIGYSSGDISDLLRGGLTQSVQKTIESFDAFADWPWNLMYRELWDLYGDRARYILTVRRSPEIWLRSMKRHAIVTPTQELRAQVYGVSMPHAYEKHFFDHYTAHISMVREFFAKLDASHLLLELEIGGPGDWAALTNFLGRTNRHFEGFQRENVSEERSRDPRVVFANLISANTNLRGHGCIELTVDEAMCLVPEPTLHRGSLAAQEIRRHADFAVAIAAGGKVRHSFSLKTALGLKKRRNTLSPKIAPVNVDPLNAYVQHLLAMIEKHHLFGVSDIEENGGNVGWVVARDSIPQTLSFVLGVFLRAGGLLPNLLFPRRFSDFLFLYKYFSTMLSPSIEDKLRTLDHVPKHVRDKLRIPARPYISKVANFPDDPDIPQGQYYWKANHGHALMKKVTYPVANAHDRVKYTDLAQSWLDHPGNVYNRQWWNDQVDRRIYLEEDLGKDGRTPQDWKLFVLGGHVEIIQVDTDRDGNHLQSIFDRDFNFIPGGIYFNAGPEVPRPDQLSDMIEIAEAIGQPFEFLRVDLFIVSGDIVLGELSIVPNAGGRPLNPDWLDRKLGDLWPATSNLRLGLDWADQKRSHAAKPQATQTAHNAFSG